MRNFGVFISERRLRNEKNPCALWNTEAFVLKKGF